MGRFRAGQRVGDRRAEEDVELVVLDPDRGDAAEVEIESLDETVADVNAEYPPDDRVVECVHVEWLDRHVGEWEQWEANTFPERLAAYAEEWSLPLRTYYYPESRLDSVGNPMAERASGQSSIDDWSR